MNDKPLYNFFEFSKRFLKSEFDKYGGKGTGEMMLAELQSYGPKGWIINMKEAKKWAC